jgi:glycosyltransferase involved in cell wall biosynthesis
VPRQRVIGIDASRIAAEYLTGTETYTLELLRALSELRPQDAFELYFNASSPPASAPLLGTPLCMPFPRFWAHARLSLAMARRRPAVLFVPAHVISVIHPRSVVTIHDLGYLVIPEAHPAKDRRRLDWSTRWNARAASRIIAISHATKQDLVEHYGVAPEKIAVVHHGVSPRFRPAAADEIARMRAALGIEGPYVLAVGTIQPRKNYARLAKGMELVRRSRPDLSLVIAGKRGWLAEQVLTELGRHAEANVRILDYVPLADLSALYSGAAVYCQPSLYEGFGMPILEAMACGSPVVAANASALPEVAGDAALLVDPSDDEAIGGAIARILDDDVFRRQLIEAGRERADLFTWQRCAEQTLEVLRAVRDH